MNCCCIILSYWYHQEMHWWMKRHKFCKALIFFNQTGFSFATSISLKSTVGWFKKVPNKVYVVVQIDPVKAWNFFQNVLNFIFWCLSNWTRGRYFGNSSQLCSDEVSTVYTLWFLWLLFRLRHAPKTRFSEPRFSEILNLMNKLQLPFSYFTLYHDSI